ncbi:Crp/Fnr family transcriptional regulator [Flavivirga amylovorans]|uniref:Crp/Fnr family transcriptional regulator n=1 Tax=Flavivirga amylovorans TaxID=870486 RepID=A0ABT8X1L9_9FLAO|nr:Crp/Fnr family transcriptional regulator [Flavivirga amylovorans]MDO5987608.1 Crp/Fnr family transcriptional regulator [Flavivirga amylovorans]
MLSHIKEASEISSKSMQIECTATYTALKKMKSRDINAYNEFMVSFKEGNCKRGQFLNRIHEISNNIYILKSGIVKQFRYKEDGNEYTTWFNFKGDVVIAYTSFIKQTPSKEGIKALEDCDFYSISRDMYYKLKMKYHAVDSFFREISEAYCIDSQERLFFLLALTAKQKYDYIIKNYPDFIQNLSCKEISSFIGVSPETLSRIRKYR